MCKKRKCPTRDHILMRWPWGKEESSIRGPVRGSRRVALASFILFLRGAQDGCRRVRRIAFALLTTVSACSTQAIPVDLGNPVDRSIPELSAFDMEASNTCAECCSPLLDGSADVTFLTNPDGGFPLMEGSDVHFPGLYAVNDIALNSMTDLLYVLGIGRTGGVIEVVDVNTICRSATIDLSPGGGGIAVDETTNTIFVLAEGGTCQAPEMDIWAIAGASNTTKWQAKVTPSPKDYPIGIDEELQHLYFFDTQTLTVFDIASRSVVAVVPIPNVPPSIFGGANRVSVDPVSHQIYAFGVGNDQTGALGAMLTIVDGITYKVLSQTPYPGFPSVGWFDPNGRQFVQTTNVPITAHLGSTVLSIPSDIANDASDAWGPTLGMPFGCGTAESHDWIVLAQDTSYNFVTLQFTQ